MTDSIQRIKYPELFFGFVAPIGADIGPTIAAFRAHFEARGYYVVDIKATSVFELLAKYVPPNIELDRSRSKQRYQSYIAYGNQLRERFGDGILAAACIRRVMRSRLKDPKLSNRNDEDKFTRTVFLMHQFKRKEEIDLLRLLYDRLFFQVSIYSRRGARVDYLSRRFASDDNTAGPQKYRPDAESLIQQDENEVGQRHGQRVAQIFHDADLIINLDVFDSVDTQVNRFCELIFGSNSISPNKTEYGMFLAKSAALRTLDLSRQVGAAIFSSAGEILALGSNEVPKAGGGTYWSDDEMDDRDFLRRADSNVLRKRELLGELLSILAPQTDINVALTDSRLRDSQFMDALEYGRIVHAEMSALSDAARIGHAVKGGTLYTTAFPCHMCAKHIVASGIARVVFLEPYPKSLASDLHSDSILVEGGDRGRYQKFPAVEFEHFHGVTPRRYREIFERGRRKKEDGSFLEYMGGEPVPIIQLMYPFYAEQEDLFTDSAMEEVDSVADTEDLFGA